MYFKCLSSYYETHGKFLLHLRNIFTLARIGRKYTARVIPTKSESSIKHYIKGMKQQTLSIAVWRQWEHSFVFSVEWWLRVIRTLKCKQKGKQVFVYSLRYFYSFFFLLLLNKKWPDNLSYNSPISVFMNTCSVLPGVYAKRRRDARRTEEILIHALQR